MKAAICREFGKPLSIEDVHLSAPKAGEVEVTLTACAICHSDISFIDGSWGGVLPAVYGHEAAGLVSAIGAGVTETKIGDPVLVTLIRACGDCPACTEAAPSCCETPYDRMVQSPLKDNDGNQLEQGMATAAFAQKVVVDSSQLALLPPDMDLVAASLLACGVVTGAGSVMNAAKLTAGKSAVIVGAGGVGLSAIQAANILGANPIIAVDLDETKLDQAKSLGATHGLLATDADLNDKIREITKGRGADYSFVTVGAVAAYQVALDYIAPRGEVIMVGMPPVGKEITLEPVNIAASAQVLRGTKMGDTVLSRDIPILLDWIKNGLFDLTGMVAGTYPLDKINEAISATKSGSAGRNVIVFDTD